MARRVGRGVGLQVQQGAAQIAHGAEQRQLVGRGERHFGQGAHVVVAREVDLSAAVVAQAEPVQGNHRVARSHAVYRYGFQPAGAAVVAHVGSRKPLQGVGQTANAPFLQGACVHALGGAAYVFFGCGASGPDVYLLQLARGAQGVSRQGGFSRQHTACPHGQQHAADCGHTPGGQPS